MKALFVSDLHGNEEKYLKFFRFISENKPDLVFIGGDNLPSYMHIKPFEFISELLKPQLNKLKNKLAQKYPSIFVITGNDDPAFSFDEFSEMDSEGLIFFINDQVKQINGFEIIGYQYIPPTPFLLKDWEKYDVSQYVPRGSVSPEEGIRTVEVAPNIIKYSTIKNDLDEMAGKIDNFKKTICLFHSPPYDTNMDKMIGKNINGQNEIISVGSIAIKRFIEKYQPLITLHGHIHESSEISGSWKDRIGETYCFNAANIGSELAIIQFETDRPGDAEKILI